MKTKKKDKVIELVVTNHAGVMSHITGLFSRRAFNLEGILCGRINGGEHSRIYLHVQDNERITQMIKQLAKLYDVEHVALRDDCDISFFERAGEMFE